jgi:hypothetical protein
MHGHTVLKFSLKIKLTNFMNRVITENLTVAQLSWASLYFMEALLRCCAYKILPWTIASIYALSPSFLQIHLNIALRPGFTGFLLSSNLSTNTFVYFSSSPSELPFLPLSFSLYYCTEIPLAFWRVLFQNIPAVWYHLILCQLSLPLSVYSHQYFVL